MKKIVMFLVPLMLLAIAAQAGNTPSTEDGPISPMKTLSLDNMKFSYTPGTLFDKGNTALSEQGRDALDELVIVAKGQNVDTVEINMPQDKKSATWELAVRNYLTQKGIADYNIKFVKNIMGDTKSIDVNLLSNTNAVANRK